MALWKCAVCGAEVEARCKPGKCKNCGAARDQLVKEAPADTKKKGS
ncbi:MAG TPA: radical SAM protein [Bacillota bacterium]|jgi:ABC-type ATPase with predicted acetyltransferase domain|nr:radical SAM protein [Peptococcaceae bacterium MAG4]NLW37461.1 radical SAM protein [Peptococcaceae bacterium]HPU35502.1 radical SAM protein [Bacillota bacterium]HPZ43772.1 radical SAM protein [Bacillota bacterium]HQD76193.1 radical SAM protein [Bacillota bacterium]